jgi:hypothetical protein
MPTAGCTDARVARTEGWETVTDLLHTFRQPIEDRRGAFHGRVVGRQARDGTWEGSLEFASANSAPSLLVTKVESRQQTHMQLMRWAAGLTGIYAEGALHRAHPAAIAPEAPQVPPADRPSTDQERQELRRRLLDLISALDRRLPNFDRDGEHRIVRDAAVLKRQAQDRIAELE